MDPELIGAAGAALAAILGAAFGGFWGRRSKSEKDANSAVALAKAYGGLVDDQRESLTDARQHIHRQDTELSAMRERHSLEMRALRDELRSVRDSRDSERAELEALRKEHGAAVTEVAALREEIARLRGLLTALEAQLAAQLAAKP